MPAPRVEVISRVAPISAARRLMLSSPWPSPPATTPGTDRRIMPTGIGQAMRTFTIQRHGPVFFSIVNYLIPLWATMLGVVVLGETLTAPIVLAFAVVAIGLFLSHDGGFSAGPSQPK